MEIVEDHKGLSEERLELGCQFGVENAELGRKGGGVGHELGLAGGFCRDQTIPNGVHLLLGQHRIQPNVGVDGAMVMVVVMT